jgi:hypothetical protein
MRPILYRQCNLFWSFYNLRKWKQDKNGNWEIKFFLSIVLVLVVLPFANANPNKRTTKYNIQMLGVSIGELSVTQTYENGTVMIDAVTNVNVNMLFSYRVKYVQNTIYDQGYLQSSHVETYKNGTLNLTTWMKLEDNVYLFVTDGDTTIIKDTINYSGSLIYFNEPIGVKQLCKERTGEIWQLKSFRAHTYIITDGKEREINRYYYENGILEYAEMQYPLGTIELKREMGNK